MYHDCNAIHLDNFEMRFRDLNQENSLFVDCIAFHKLKISRKIFVISLRKIAKFNKNRPFAQGKVDNTADKCKFLQEIA